LLGAPARNEPHLDSSLIIPSLEDLVQLQELTKKGRIYLLLEKAEKLEKLDRRFIPFAKHLSKLVKSFELDKINEFISQYLSS
jgi:hypothetical protein